MPRAEFRTALLKELRQYFLLKIASIKTAVEYINRRFKKYTSNFNLN